MFGIAFRIREIDVSPRPLSAVAFLLCLVLILGFSHLSPAAAISIQARIDNGPWVQDDALYPKKGQNVSLRVKEIEGATIRWYQIRPDLSNLYKNANFPWDPDPYKWVGLATIKYHCKELTMFRGLWQIEPFDNRGRIISDFNFLDDHPLSQDYFHREVGSFWFQVVVEHQGSTDMSPGLKESDERGLSPKVFRVSVRKGQGYIGYLTTFFNVPALFGSIPYQSNNYIGVDCADVLMAAYGKWKNVPVEKNHNVASLVESLQVVAETDLDGGAAGKTITWGVEIRSGDLIAIRYSGSKQYQHIGALYSDTNENGVLDSEDLVIHAGPMPLAVSPLKEGSFDGHVLILRFRDH